MEKPMETCPCGTGKPYNRCCEPLIRGEQKPQTPEALMRARYSAHVKTEVDFVVESTHPDKREGLLAEGIRRWSEGLNWHGLEILDSTGGTDGDNTGAVEFIAHYTEKTISKKHHELAEFERVDGNWYFADGLPVMPKQYVRPTPKVGRNDPCPCGSGKKHKKCCATL
jgi:SEC-C motif-containing protein